MAKSHRRRRPTPIHRSVKASLGYDPADLDEDVYDDWKVRKTRVCKPCWELKYCPYGPLVEQSPILPVTRSSAENHNTYLRSCLESGMIGQVKKLTGEDRANYTEWLNDEQILLKQAYYELIREKEIESISKIEGEQEKVRALLGNELPPIHVYRAPYEVEDSEIAEEDFEPSVWNEILTKMNDIARKYEHALSSGLDDDRHTLDQARRAWFQKSVDEFNPEDHPELIPDTFIDASCNVFGHICPVFFAAEAITETEHKRRIGRKELTFEAMMRIVRRDDYRCQHCKKS